VLAKGIFLSFLLKITEFIFLLLPLYPNVGINNMYLSKIAFQNGMLVALFLLCLLVAGVFAGIPVFGLFSFLVIQVAGILLPAFLLLKKTGLNLKNPMSTLFLSYGVGMAAWAVIYAVLIYFNIHYYASYALYAITALALLNLLDPEARENVRSSLGGKNQDNSFLIVLFFVLVVFGFLVFQFPHRLVADTGFLDMHMDQTYWFKNCVASTKGYPLPELSVSGVQLYWHLFSSFNVALFHLATGIEIYHLCFSLSYIWHIFLMLGGAYALANEVLSNRKYVLMVLILTLLCSSAEPLTLVYYLDHLWGCSMGTSDAIAESMFAMLLLIKTIENRQVNWRLVPLLTLMVVAAAGYKSPVGLILLVGVGSACLILFWNNRKTLVPALGMLLLVVLSVVVLLKTFVIAADALTSSTSNHKLAFNFMTVLWPEINSHIIAFLEQYGVKPRIVEVMLVIPYLLTVHPVMPVLAVVLVGLFLKRKKLQAMSYKQQTLWLPLIAMSIVGTVAFIVLGHPGFAQCYFLFAGIPFAILFSFLVIETYFNEAYRKYCRLLYVLIGCSFVVTVGFARETYVLEGKYAPDPGQKSVEGTSLTGLEWEGLVWVREHLPESAVMVTNKGLAPVAGERSYVTSAYTERQVFLEGYVSTIVPNDHFIPDRKELMKRYFSGDAAAREELKQAGVTHVVVYKSLPDVVFEGGNLLFENEEIAIRTI